MASEPYLLDKFMGCFNAPRVPKLEPNPECTIDKYTKFFRDRWSVLRPNPCKKLEFKALDDACCNLNCSVKNVEKTCDNPGSWACNQSLYQKDFKFPTSHNNIDDCCPSDCCCADSLPNYCRGSKNVAYAPQREWEVPAPPLDLCTTYNYYYKPHQVEPRKNPKPPEQYQPCSSPMEECTTTQSDYTRKHQIPNGPAKAQIYRHGLWSVDQFCKEFRDETTSKQDFGPKCGRKRGSFRYSDNLIIPRYPLKTDTETASQFYCKTEMADPTHCFHPWLDNDYWNKPETPLEKCTTYNHFYKRYPPPAPRDCRKTGSPDAIPFCSINGLCYSCYDPKPNQKTPVEMKDNDPWPIVKTCPIRYQDNLQIDPCSTFKDETTQKADYTPKTLCRPNPNFAPLAGYIPPNTPFNDDTTMKVSFRKYTADEYKDSKGESGNPCGIKYGPNICPVNQNKCLPRFSAPYGDPLKPFNCQHGRCPCGPFDDRSTYNQDFRFRNKAEVEAHEEEMCRKINVPKGVSLYRFDFVRQYGKKAAKMPPPRSVGYRCMHPCTIQDLDTLNRISYRDIWKTMDRGTLELYRGKPVMRRRRIDENCQPRNSCCEDGDPLCPDDEPTIIYQPIYVKKPKKKQIPCPKPMPLINNIWLNNAQEQDGSGDNNNNDCSTNQNLQRCKKIPYGGHNILNRAENTYICNGQDGR